MTESGEVGTTATSQAEVTPRRETPEALGTKLQRYVWERRANTWDEGGVVGLDKVIRAVLEEAAAAPGMVAVDLGCGTGQLAIPLAQAGAHVKAVDISQNMILRLHEKAMASGVGGIEGLVSAAEQFDLPEQSVDLVVTNYVLHHLRDEDKERVVQAAARWLKPGGRLVVGDMMFGRGATARDREIIGSKVVAMVKKGPAGWWRLAKNVVRFSFRIQERPVSLATWQAYFGRAGFDPVVSRPVVNEAAVVTGVRAGAPNTASSL